jgi:hypothetical protein
MNPRLALLAASVSFAAIAPRASGQIQIGDNFAQFHDYATGSVPAGGYWTGVHNPTTGAGGERPANFQASGVDANGTPKPGVLLIEDLGGFAGPGGPGVGWERSRTTAPLLYREIPAAANFDAKIKIVAQTSGQWSMAGLVARLKGPPVGVGPADADENFVAAFAFRADEANPDRATLLTRHIENGEQRTDANLAWDSFATPEPAPLYLRLLKTGQRFASLTSLDGVAWLQRTVVTAPELATPGSTIQIGPSFMMAGGGFDGAGAGAAEFDDFEMTHGPIIDAHAAWHARGGGSWNDPANWASVLGDAPSGVGLAVRLGAATDADATIFLDKNVTVGRLEFEHNRKYAIAGAGTLVLHGSFVEGLPGRLATIFVDQGAHEFQAAVALNTALRITTQPGARLDFNHAVELNGHTLTITGGGVVSFNNGIVPGLGGSVVYANEAAETPAPEPAGTTLAAAAVLAALVMRRRDAQRR